MGSAIYFAHRDEARVAVLGAGYATADVPAAAEAIGRALREVLEQSPLYQALSGIANIFMKLLKMIVIPLVFFSLVVGIAGLGDVARLGRIGLKTFGLYMLTSFLAILTGLTLVNWIRPGDGASFSLPATAVLKEKPGSLWEVVTNMVPDNVVRAAAEFDLFGVIFFAVLFGIFLLTLAPEKKAPMLGFIEAGAEIMMKMTHFVITLAPIGILALIARMVASTGPEVFLQLIAYVFTVLAALGVHLLVTLPILLWVFTRRNPYRYLRTMSSALMTAFSTASSSGTLGVTLERAEKGAGISNRVASFVLPVGATVNMDGTALYEITSVLFIAQVHAGIDPNFTLTFADQLLVVFLGLMVSIGAAGIPHAGLVMMVIILEAVGLPIEYTSLVWAVDRVLDMSRTMVNVGSDATVTMIVAHGEGEVSEPPGVSPLPP